MTGQEKTIEEVLGISIADYGKGERYAFQQLHEIMEKDFGDIAWVVEGLFPMESISIISGNPGNFKTWITMDLARSIAEGTSFLGKFQTMQGGVLIVDEENAERVIKDRFIKLDVANNEKLPIYYLNRIGFKIDDKKDLEEVISFVKENDIKLVIFDSLVRIHSGDENTSQTMSKVMRSFQEVVKAGASVISTHHHRKGPSGPNPSQSLRGSSDILAGIDCHIIITHSKEENCLHFSQPKLRTDEPINDFLVSIKKTEKGELVFTYEGDDKRAENKIQEVKNEIIGVMQMSDTSMSVKDFKEELGDSFSENNIRGALKALTKEEMIKFETKGKGERFYSLIVIKAESEEDCG